MSLGSLDVENVLRGPNSFYSEDVLFIAFARVEGLVNIFSLSQFLIPIPFIDLAFCQTQELRELLDLLLRPIPFFHVFVLEDLGLSFALHVPRAVQKVSNGLEFVRSVTDRHLDSLLFNMSSFASIQIFVQESLIEEGV